MQPQQILNDRYQLKKTLGDNFNRQTWLAKDLETRELVVVKCLVLGEGRSDQWTYLKLFEREAQVLQQLDHDYIPQYRDYFPISDRNLWFALVEEYIPGDTLAELLEQGKKFTEAQVRGVAIAILEILIYLHELNPPVLHRDIKPSNLIWHEASEEENPEIYLVDFGAVQDKANTEGKTITIVGTYGYAPMEQFGGRTVAASDLYALGATLIHLLTGIPPADLPQNEFRIDFSDRTSASKKLVQWIENLTEPNLKLRPQTAREALDLFISDRVNLELKSTNPRPKGSKVEVTSTPMRLSIKISGARIYSIFRIIQEMFFSLLSGAFLILFITHLVFYILRISTDWFYLPSLIFIVLRVSGKLFNLFTYHVVHFNHDRFSIEKRVFGLVYKRLRARITDIKHIFTSIKVDKDDLEYQMVMIQTERKSYTFGKDLTTSECIWLVEEIKEWLNEARS
jgi:serine/threonine protein kinase